MKTIIIEDEHLTAQRLQHMLHRYDPAIEVLAVIPSVSQAVNWFRENPDPDLVFMDIHLEDEQCFSIFERINLEIPVIFTTAYDEYIVKAFKVNSVDYLMKPIDYEELVNAIEKLKQKYLNNGMEEILQAFHRKEPSYKERFLVTAGSKLLAIETDKIQCFYFAEKITLMVTTNKQHLPVEYSLDKLMLLLDPSVFFRVNRQVLARHSAIENMHVYSKGRIRVDLNPPLKKEVFISQDKITSFKEWLGK